MAGGFDSSNTKRISLILDEQIKNAGTFSRVVREINDMSSANKRLRKELELSAKMQGFGIDTKEFKTISAGVLNKQNEDLRSGFEKANRIYQQQISQKQKNIADWNKEYIKEEKLESNHLIKQTQRIMKGEALAELSKRNNLEPFIAKKSLATQGISQDKQGQFIDVTGKQITNQEELDRALQSGSRSLQRFNMNALGVMFAGMALNRAMMNLNATAWEWVGITELMSTAMGVVFLPITLELLDTAIIPLVTWLMDLSDTSKLVIGGLSLLAAGAGALMFAYGQLSLGIGSLVGDFGKLANTKVGSKTLSFISSGFEALGLKMNKWQSWAKLGGATILFGLALKDGAEGDFIASIGDVMMGAALLTGGWVGGALLTLGFTMKVLGDEEFRKSVESMGITFVDKMLYASEIVSEMFSDMWDAIKSGDFSGISESISKAWKAATGGIGEESSQIWAEKFSKGEITSKTGKIQGAGAAMESLSTMATEYTDKNKILTSKQSDLEGINTQIASLKTKYQETEHSYTMYKNSLDSLSEVYNSSRLSQSEYNSKLKEITLAKNKGTMKEEEYNSSLSELKLKSNDSKIATEEYNRVTKELSDKYAPTIGAHDEYTKELAILTTSQTTLTGEIDTLSSYIKTTLYPNMVSMNDALIKFDDWLGNNTEGVSKKDITSDKYGYDYSSLKNTLSTILSGENINLNKTSSTLTKVMATGGEIYKSGAYYLHEGEYVTPKSEVSANQSVIISPTYYVTVSDKKEFVALLEANNKKIVNEVTRSVKV
jgi:hypothetical protein